jgi:hypothetical protein
MTVTEAPPATAAADPERTLVHAGRLALGLPTERPDGWGA